MKCQVLFILKKKKKKKFRRLPATVVTGSLKVKINYSKWHLQNCQNASQGKPWGKMPECLSMVLELCYVRRNYELHNFIRI